MPRLPPGPSGSVVPIDTAWTEPAASGRAGPASGQGKRGPHGPPPGGQYIALALSLPRSARASIRLCSTSPAPASLMTPAETSVPATWRTRSSATSAGCGAARPGPGRSGRTARRTRSARHSTGSAARPRGVCRAADAAVLAVGHQDARNDPDIRAAAETGGSNGASSGRDRRTADRAAGGDPVPGVAGTGGRPALGAVRPRPLSAGKSRLAPLTPSCSPPRVCLAARLRARTHLPFRAARSPQPVAAVRACGAAPARRQHINTICLDLAVEPPARARPAARWR